MNTYNELIKYLKTTFEADSMVSTVTTDGYNDMDNWRKNVYPIVDINVLNEPFTENTAISRYNVEITVADIRDVNKEEVNDKFWRNDNRHDNWNTTHKILKTARGKVKTDNNDSGIELVTATPAERLIFVKENALDGWQQTWTIDVDDDYTTIC